MISNQSIYDAVMAELQAKRVPQRAVAKGSAVPFSTLTKIAQGRIKAPSVHHVQALFDYFVKVGGSDPAFESHQEAQATPEHAPGRALACTTQSVRLTADRRDADRRDLVRRAKPVDVPQPNQLPLALSGEPRQEAA